MATYQTSRGGKSDAAKLVSKQEAVKRYAEQKAKAQLATKEQYAILFLEHSGNPGKEFVDSVRLSEEMTEIFIKRVKRALESDIRSETFYLLSGLVLNVAPEHLDVWAKDIAEMILDNNHTLQ